MTSWQAQPGVTFEVTPEGLWCNGAAALRTDKQRGRWLLPVFMAGIYEIGVTPEGSTSSAGLAAFAHEASRLKVDIDDLQRFSNWLWGEGAEGIRLGIGVGILEVASIREQTDKTSQSDQIRAVRMTAVLGENTSSVSAIDLDRAAVLEELQVPLNVYQQGAAASAFRMQSDERRSLARSVDEAARWMTIELGAVVAGSDRLRSRVPAARLVRACRDRIVQTTTSSEIERLYDTIATLRGQRADVWDGLVAADLGVLLGEKLAPDAALVRAVLNEPSLSPGFARALLRTSLGQPPSAALAQLGVQQLSAAASVATLTDDQVDVARALVRVACAHAPADVAAVFHDLPKRLRNAVFDVVDAPAAASITNAIVETLARPEILPATVALVGRAGVPALHDALARRLVASRGACCAGDALKAACELLSALDDHAVDVVRLANHPFTHRDIKMVALVALRAAPASIRLTAATAFTRHFEDDDLFALRQRLLPPKPLRKHHEP
jgi:hypothetical protein